MPEEEIQAIGHLTTRDTIIEEKENEIGYLRDKLDWYVEQIESEMENYPQNIIQEVKDSFETEKLEQQAEEYYSEDKENVAVHYHIDIKMISTPLFYYFEDFIINSKRIVEFSLRTLRELQNTEKWGEPLNVQNFLKQIRGDQSPSEFVEYLFDNHPDFVEYIEENEGWLEGVRKHREDLAHRKIDFWLDNFSFTEVVKGEGDKTPQETPELKLYGEEVDEYVKERRRRLDDFVEKVDETGTKILSENQEEIRQKDIMRKKKEKIGGYVNWLFSHLS